MLDRANVFHSSWSSIIKGVRKNFAKFTGKQQKDWRPKACNFIKKETLTQVVSYGFCKVFKSTFFTDQLRTTASISAFVTSQFNYVPVIWMFCRKTCYEKIHNIHQLGVKIVFSTDGLMRGSLHKTKSQFIKNIYLYWLQKFIKLFRDVARVPQVY